MVYAWQACVNLQSPLWVPYPLRDLALLNIEKTWLWKGHSLHSRARKKFLCKFTIQRVSTSLSQEKYKAPTQERKNDLELGCLVFPFDLFPQETDPSCPLCLCCLIDLHLGQSKDF